MWYDLWSFGIFFSVLVCLYQEKSGNPGLCVCERKKTEFIILHPLVLLPPLLLHSPRPISPCEKSKDKEERKN
jgi:hypothetical protein